jgi:hypothetical protein
MQSVTLEPEWEEKSCIYRENEVGIPWALMPMFFLQTSEHLLIL